MRAGALVLFGATGDLARKKLFPALYHLAAAKQLGVPVVGVASRTGTTPGCAPTPRRRCRPRRARWTTRR